jgi:hypothetical protein
MWSEFIKSIWIILPAAAIGVVLEGVRAFNGLKPGAPTPIWTLFGFLVISLAFGFLAIIVYHQVSIRWPQNPQQLYLYIAIVCAALLTVLAVVMRFAFKITWLDVIAWTVINWAFGLGYGLYLPKILG